MLIDPDKLRTIPDLAEEFGYHPGYLSRVAKEGGIKAWRYGNTWVTTREIVEAYTMSSPGPGRPKQTKNKKKSK